MAKKRRFTIEKREYARNFVDNRISYFNKFYNFKINRVAIKNQTTRWGSCSSKGNLNFNYKIIYLKPVLADYLIVHELCHLGELNHSKKFWALVLKTIPDYAKTNKELRKTPIRSI
jgi:predicted metal-dependent hydrolase